MRRMPQTVFGTKNTVFEESNRRTIMGDQPARAIDVESLFELVTELDAGVHKRFDFQDEKFEAGLALILDTLIKHGLSVNERLDKINQRLAALEETSSWYDR